MMVRSSLSGTRTWSPHPRRPALGLSCRCPPDMRMALVIGLHRSRFSCFCSDFKMWCHGDRSHASLISIAHQSTACLGPPPCLPLMASSMVRATDLPVVTLGLPRPVVVLVPGVPGASGASHGATDVEVVGTGP
jgi:hypothetical protein